VIYDQPAMDVAIDQEILKPSDIKGPIRGGRVWGWYFLPADTQLGLPEMIIDLRRLHTIQIDLLRSPSGSIRRDPPLWVVLRQVCRRTTR
jgi:hypothetical protein